MTCSHTTRTSDSARCVLRLDAAARVAAMQPLFRKPTQQRMSWGSRAPESHLDVTDDKAHGDHGVVLQRSLCVSAGDGGAVN